MRTDRQFTRKVLLGLITLWSLCASAYAAIAEDMPPGIAFVTSTQGQVDISHQAGGSIRPKLHEILQLDTSTIETGKNAHLFLALSNGMGLGIDQNSEVLIETYTQKPFTAAKESLLYEPSVSILSIRIVSGSLAIASKHRSPLSKATIQILSGELRIDSTTCVITIGERGAQISAYAGTATYQYPNIEKREFIVPPQSIRISPQSDRQGRPSETSVLSDLPKERELLAQATEQASQRVFFKASDTEATPQPILIISPEYFEQPVVRPYEFTE